MLPELRQLVQSVKQAEDDACALAILVEEIQRIIGTDTCSVFVLNYRTDHFILMATQGLAPEAVGQLQVPSAKGLLGYIYQKQERLRLSHAKKHPAFLAVPDLGEDRCKAYLGVPLIHRRRVVGIIVLQQFGRRQFSKTDEAYMLTLSTQLADYVSGIALAHLLTSKEHQDNTPYYWQGASISLGLCIGTPFIKIPLKELSEIPDRPCEDVSLELRSFRKALIATQKELKQLTKQMSSMLGEQEKGLFEAYEQMIMDQSLVHEIENHIRDGLWAPGALRRVISGLRQQFLAVDDPYIQERTCDLDDLARRLLTHLLSAKKTLQSFPAKGILVANEISAAMLAEVPRTQLVGVISLKGSSTSHAAILARALGVPAVFGLKSATLEEFPSTEIILDGYSGHVIASPDEHIMAHYQNLLKLEKAQAKRLAKSRREPATTLDGHNTSLLLNIGMALDWEMRKDVGAEGVGLYRTEVAFMLQDRFPSEDEQIRIYTQVLNRMKKKTVVIRVLDIGGDKSLPYFPIQDKNPYLGWRGIRVMLDHPDIFLVQLRAMLKANLKSGNLKIALPMIAHVSELDQCLNLYSQAYQEVLEESQMRAVEYPRPEMGIVVEVPSAVYQIRALAKRVDFVSIGTNDLTQYLLAIDRNNEKVSEGFDSLHPAVLQAVRATIDGAKAEGKPVHICGEMAADPFGAALLVAMEVDALSMNSNSLPRVRQMIRAISLMEAKQLLAIALLKENASEVRLYMQQQFERLKLGALIRAGG